MPLRDDWVNGSTVNPADLNAIAVAVNTLVDTAATAEDIAAAIATLKGDASAALDTLKELEDALGGDADFATTITNAIAAKQPLDEDLTALSGVATQAFGRSLLTTADADAARTALRAADASAAGAMRNLMTKLGAAVSDAVIVINSDSTGNDTTEWAYLTTQWLAAEFPAYTVNYYLWDTGGNAWPGSPTVVQTGSGSYTLTVWNAAVSGSTTAYFHGSRFSNLVKNADLILVNHGFNQGGPLNTDNLRQLQRNSYLSFVDELAQVNPHAGVVLIGQPPSGVAGREEWQAQRNALYGQAAAWRGWGFIDVHRAWLEYGDWEADLTNVDGTHPTTTGSALWASLVEAALENAARIPVTTQPAQVRPARQVFKNPQLSAWNSTLPDGVSSVTNCTVAKELTDYETGSQAMTITSDATSAGAYVEITGTATEWGIKGRLADRAYTMAVRIKAPTANAQTVRVSLLDNNGGTYIQSTDMGATARDRYLWLYVTKLFPSNATTLTARIYVKTSGTSVVSATVDEILLFPGVVPHTGADRDTLGSLSTTDGDFVRRVGGVYVGNTLAQVKTDLALVPADAGAVNTVKTYASGYWYACGLTGQASTAIPTLNRIIYQPWIVTAAVTVAEVLAEFTAAGSSDSFIRLGFYNDDGTGKPGTLIADLGSISTGTGNAGVVATGGTPGPYTIGSLSVLIPFGLVWVASKTEGTTAATMRIPSSAAVVPPNMTFGTATPVAAQVVGTWAQATTAGALPSTAAASFTTAPGGARTLFKAA